MTSCTTRGTGSGCGDAPELDTKDIVKQEFTTGEPGLVFPDDRQPTAVHLHDGTEVEVEVPAPLARLPSDLPGIRIRSRNVVNTKSSATGVYYVARAANGPQAFGLRYGT